MAILYKPFKRFRTVLCVLAAGLLCWAGPVSAQSNPYVIEGVKVDISADNAMNARTQAFEKGQQDAIAALAAQFFSETRLAAFRPPPVDVISPMIQDYEVTQEKLSSQRYIGIYTFRFKREAVNRYFETAGQDLTAVAGPAPTGGGLTGGYYGGQPLQDAWTTDTTVPVAPRDILILPFYRIGQQTMLWSAYNGWMQAWRRAGLGANQTLPLGDVSDIADIGDDAALNYDEAGMARILARYNAREAVIVIASPDATLVRLATDSDLAAGMMRIDIYRTDRRDGPTEADQLMLTPGPGETRGRFFDRAVLQVEQALQSDWKNTAGVVQTSAASTIELRVPFANLQEWAGAQRTLGRIQGVNDIVLKSLTPREARIGVVYEGSADTLRIALQQAGMDLSDPVGSDGDAAPYPGAAVYDLYLSPRVGAPYAPAGLQGPAPVPEIVPGPLQAPDSAPAYEQPSYTPSGNQPYTRSF